jgi:hypothetical protein
MGVDLGGIMDRDASKVLGGVPPPLSVLRPVAVAAGLVSADPGWLVARPWMT